MIMSMKAKAKVNAPQASCLRLWTRACRHDPDGALDDDHNASLIESPEVALMDARAAVEALQRETDQRATNSKAL
jgi:hypothetical protein